MTVLVFTQTICVWGIWVGKQKTCSSLQVQHERKAKGCCNEKRWSTLILHFPGDWKAKKKRTFRIHSKFFQANMHVKLHHFQGGFFFICSLVHIYFRLNFNKLEIAKRTLKLALQQCKTSYWISLVRWIPQRAEENPSLAIIIVILGLFIVEKYKLHKCTQVSA